MRCNRTATHCHGLTQRLKESSATCLSLERRGLLSAGEELPEESLDLVDIWPHYADCGEAGAGLIALESLERLDVCNDQANSNTAANAPQQVR